MTYRNRRLLDAARLLPCQNCGTEDGTVVACHVNHFRKGVGHKPPDYAIWSGCFRCHTEYDQGRTMGRQARREFADEMNLKTLREMIERGILTAREK